MRVLFFCCRSFRSTATDVFRTLAIGFRFSPMGGLARFSDFVHRKKRSLNQCFWNLGGYSVCLTHFCFFNNSAVKMHVFFSELGRSEEWYWSSREWPAQIMLPMLHESAIFLLSVISTDSHRCFSHASNRFQIFTHGGSCTVFRFCASKKKGA